MKRGDRYKPGDEAAPLTFIDVMVEGQRFQQDLVVVAEIVNDPEGVSKALAGSASLVALFGCVEAALRVTHDNLELAVKRQRSKLFLEYGKEKPGEKAPTVEAKKAMVDVDPSVIRLEDDLVQAKSNLDKVVNARWALADNRHSALLNLSTTMRSEIEAGHRDSVRSRLQNRPLTGGKR